MDANVDCEPSDKLVSVISEKKTHVLRELGNEEYYDIIANKNLKRVGDRLMKKDQVYLTLAGELPEMTIEESQYPVKVFLAQNESK